MGPIQTILRRRFSRSAVVIYPDLPLGYVFMTDERGKRLLDEEQDYLIDRKEN